jgi:hypothetical protein
VAICAISNVLPGGVIPTQVVINQETGLPYGADARYEDWEYLEKAEEEGVDAEEDA